MARKEKEFKFPKEFVMEGIERGAYYHGNKRYPRYGTFQKPEHAMHEEEGIIGIYKLVKVQRYKKRNEVDVEDVKEEK